jgi:PAS domain S-box-containing protein
MSGRFQIYSSTGQMEHLSKVAALLPAGIFSVNAEGRITFFNSRAAELWGRQPELNEPLEHFYRGYKIFLANGMPVTPDEAPTLQAIRNGRPCRDAEAVFWRADGSRFVVKMNVDPIFDARGKICGAINVLEDITHRKRAEEALHESEERFRTLASNAPVGIFMTDLEGKTISVNDYWCEMTGLGAEATRDNGWLRALHTEDRTRIADGWREALRQCRESKAEFRFLHANGKVIWVQGHAVPLRDANGRHIGYIGTVADITERKCSEQAAQQLAAIVESSDEAIISKDLNGIVTSWNHGAERIFGYRADEMIGKPITMLIPTDRHAEETEILRKIRRGQPIKHFETVRRCKDGRLIDISLTISPIRDANGKIIGASKIARDVTEKKRDEETQHVLYELVANMNRGMDLPAIYDAALDAIVRCQKADRASILLYDDNKIMRFRAWRNLSESYRRAVEGHSPWKPDDRAPQPVFIGDISKIEIDYHLRKLVAAEGIRALAFIPITYESRLLGKFMIYYDAPHPFSLEEIRPAQTIANQIAFAIERKRAETELKRARDEAQRANRAKDDFLAALSHELRTPLNPVLLIASDSANDHALPPRVRHAFDTIRKNVELEARLIDDLLDISRITCGKMTMEMDAVDVHAAICAALEKVQSDLGQKEIALKLNLNAPEFEARGDAVRLQQVFWNLLKNAVKFTAPRGSIAVNSRVEKNELVLSISDSGVGMTPAELTRSFDAFSQGEHATTNQFGGMGLGLAISRSIVGAHFGRIWAESEGRGKGSTFIVALPLLKTISKPDGRISKTNGHAAAPGKNQKSPLAILLVEDHEPTRNSLAELLARRRHKVAAAASLDEARSLAQKQKFDVLISDIGLPDGNGADLMRELSVQKNLKGIALTGYGMEQDIVKSQSAGFIAHLTKPVRIESLDNTLAEIF